jgi:hypothetical protein
MFQILKAKQYGKKNKIWERREHPTKSLEIYINLRNKNGDIYYIQ